MPRLLIKVGREIRFEGALCPERMVFEGRDRASLPLLHPIGSLFRGVDIDRVRLHGPLPVTLRRAGEVVLSLRIAEAGAGEEATLEGQGLVFSPSTDSVGGVLTELGI